MAKEDSTKAPTPAKPAKAAEPAAPKDPGTPAKDAPVEETTSDRGERVSDCVVNGGRGMHVGRAVNGKVCSYHAMHYDNAGNRR